MAGSTWRRGLLAFLLTVLLAAGCSDNKQDAKAPETKSFGALGSGAAGSPSAYTPTGKIIADNGFRPEKDGFSFENYGAVPEGEPPRPDLTAADVRKLFGDNVCRIVAADRCELTPPAEAWMETTNKDMGGGHCYGLAVSSSLFFQKQEEASTYGADEPPALRIEENPALARHIAYTWAFQTLDSVNGLAIKGTPAQILEKLVSSLVPDPQETYTIGIFQRDGNGGHAITPFAVEDHEDGRFSVLVYDNNYPTVTRQLVIDRDEDTWNYVASTNPQEAEALYEGDAETKSLDLTPTTPGLGTQPCPFCNRVPPENGAPMGQAGGVTGKAADDADLDLIYMDGSEDDHGHLLITDDQGRQTGYLNGAYVNNIPGSKIVRAFSSKPWLDAAEPDYRVPTGKTYTIVLDGTGVKETDPTTIGIISSSFEMLAGDIQLDPGQKDIITVGPFGTALSYKTDRAESPILEIGVSDEVADYLFEIYGESYEAGSSVNLTLPLDAAEGLAIDTNVESGQSRFDLRLTRTDGTAEEVFTHDDIELNGADAAVLRYADWDEEGEGIPYGISRNGVIETEVLKDSK